MVKEVLISGLLLLCFGAICSAQQLQNNYEFDLMNEDLLTFRGGFRRFIGLNGCPGRVRTVVTVKAIKNRTIELFIVNGNDCMQCFPRKCTVGNNRGICLRARVGVTTLTYYVTSEATAQLVENTLGLTRTATISATRIEFQIKSLTVLTCACCPYGTTIGDPRYRTLDGAKILYNGTCPYNLASGPDFQIIASNVRARPHGHFSSIGSVTVTYKGDTVTLLKGNKVLVNGLEYTGSFPLYLTNMVVRKEGDTLVVSLLEIDVTVSYNGVKCVANIYIPPAFAGQMTGLYGNFDGNAENDLETEDGSSVSDDNDGYYQIGQSWKIDPNCVD